MQLIPKGWTCRWAAPGAPPRQASGPLGAEAVEAAQVLHARRLLDSVDAAATSRAENGTQTLTTDDRLTNSVGHAEASTQTESMLPAEQAVQQLRAELAGLRCAPVLSLSPHNSL